MKQGAPTAPSFPDSFSTARLRAERLTAGHFDDVLRMHSDPRQMEPLGGIRDEAQTVAYLDYNLQHWAEHGFGLWILRDRATNQVAGRGMLRHLLVEDSDEIEVGYSLHPEFWGRGLATEIAAACIHHGAVSLNLRSVVAITLPDNTRSQRVMTKVGMIYQREVVQDGVLHVLFRSRPLSSDPDSPHPAP